MNNMWVLVITGHDV